MKTSLQNVEKDFVVAFSKIGPKHNAAKQIDAFKQKEDKSVIEGLYEQAKAIHCEMPRR